ncbi:hypothetical protein ABZN20_10295 [Methylococcus sp. ANG]|uniref:hypothetical protein n=1 Tax=Methylococcus sp. ANG TaxID=3231903 RepID=UPI0034578BE6
MIEQAKAAQGGHPNAALKIHKTGGTNYPQATHGTQPRLPPFARQLRPRADRSLVVVVGRRGWELFQHPGRAGIDYSILLPDPNPTLYRWPSLAGWADAMIVDTDGTLTRDDEREIARALLVSGCPYIVGRWTSYARRAQA